MAIVNKRTLKSEYREKSSPHEIELPQSIIDSYARFLVPEIRKFYDSEEGKRAFEEWQQEQGDARANS